MYRRVLIVSLTLSFVATAVWAQQNATNTPAASQSPFEYKPLPQEAELIKLSREWMDAALFKKDMRRLDELMAPEYNLQAFDVSKAPQPLAKWLEVITTAALQVDAFEYTSINAQVYGDLGIVYSTFRWSGKFHGTAFTDTGVIVDVWRMRKGKWQIVSRRSAGQSLLGKLTQSTEPKSKDLKER